MTIANKAALQAQINTLFADNNSGDITPEDLRTYLTNSLDSKILQAFTTVEDNATPVNLVVSDIDQNAPRVPVVAGTMVYNLPDVTGVTAGVALILINELNETRTLTPFGGDTILGATDITTPGILIATADPTNSQWLTLAEPFAPYIGSENVIVINSADDFPDAVGGVIELIPAGTPEIVYLIAAKDIDVGTDVFTITDGECVIRGVHRTASRITSAGTDPLFTCSNSSFFQEFLAVDHPNGDIFDYTATGLPFSLANQNLIVINCQSLGSIDGAFTSSFRTLTVIDTQVGGFLWSGANATQINISNFLGLDWTGNLLDLGTATFDLISMAVGSRFESSVGNTILSGAASSANLKAGGLAIVDGNIFNGDGTAISGIDTEDLQWDFKNNVFSDNVTKNTRNVAGAFLTSSQTVTITVIGTYVAIGGANWSSDFDDRFTVGTDGLITYIGLSAIDINVNYSLTIDKVGGGSDLLCAKIAINGTVADKSISCTDNATPTGISSGGLFSISNGDTIQMFVANDDSTANITVSEGNMRVTGG